MKPLLLPSVDTFVHLPKKKRVFYLFNTPCPKLFKFSFVSPPTKTLLHLSNGKRTITNASKLPHSADFEVKSFWYLGGLQQAFVCLCIPR